MKISCTQENVLQALQYVTHVAGKNTTLPILQNILLRAVHGHVECTGTNLEIGIRATVRAKIEEEGSLTIPARLFLEYISLLPQERVDMETINQKLSITCKNFHTTILGAPAEDFPLLPERDGGTSVTLSAASLREGITSVLFAAAGDETRPEINGIFLRIDGGKIIFTATDSYRLAEKRLALENAPSEHVSVILPHRTMQELQRILGSVHGNITVTFGENQVFVQGEDFLFTTRMIDGQYPDYEQIIPPKHVTRATLPTDQVLKAVRGASLFSPSGVNDIRLHFVPAKSELVIAASSGQVGENTITVPGEVLGDENTIVFNWRYLIDGIERAQTDTIVFDTVNATSPGVIRPKNGRGYTYLIMPIKQ